jgi:hypothetical protein
VEPKFHSFAKVPCHLHNIPLTALIQFCSGTNERLIALHADKRLETGIMNGELDVPTRMLACARPVPAARRELWAG